VVDPTKRIVGFTDSADDVMDGDIDDGTKDDLDKDEDDEQMTDFAKQAKENATKNHRCSFFWKSRFSQGEQEWKFKIYKLLYSQQIRNIKTIICKNDNNHNRHHHTPATTTAITTAITSTWK